MIVRVQGASEVQNGIYYEYDTESQPLGQGGMGIVYQGYCFRVDNPQEYIPVAIKLITNTTQDLIERAMREASIQIDHPNLLRMWGFIPNMEWDMYTQSYKPKYYVVMDRLVGVDLFSLMKGVTIDKSGYNVTYAQELYNKFISDRLAFVGEVMGGVLNAIAALHEKGYIHRDIDPSNVMITDDNGIKLIDFGISKSCSTQDGPVQKLTQVGSIIGKADYAAPEIVTGDVMNHNFTTDIYALGIMLYQLYTGSLPYSGSDPEIMQAQLNQPVPVENINHMGIRAVVERATRKKQSERYQSVTEMMDEFQRALAMSPEAAAGKTTARGDRKATLHAEPEASRSEKKASRAEKKASRRRKEEPVYEEPAYEEPAYEEQPYEETSYEEKEQPRRTQAGGRQFEPQPRQEREYEESSYEEPAAEGEEEPYDGEYYTPKKQIPAVVWGLVIVFGLLLGGGASYFLLP